MLLLAKAKANSTFELAAPLCADMIYRKVHCLCNECKNSFMDIFCFIAGIIRAF